MKRFLLFALFALPAMGQAPPAVIYQTPPASCTNAPPIWVSGSSLYICVGGVPTALSGGPGGGVASINTVAGAFTFNGTGVSCTSTTCTFAGGLSGLTTGVFPIATSATAIGDSIFDYGNTTTLTATLSGAATGGFQVINGPISAHVTGIADQFTFTFQASQPTAPTSSQMQLVMGTDNGAATYKRTDMGTFPPIFNLASGTGAITAIVSNGQYGPVLIPRAAILESISAVTSTFTTCTVSPRIDLEDCGVSAGTCASPTSLGNVTLTAANTITVGTITTAAVTAGHYLVWKTTAGTCAGLDATFSAVGHNGVF